MKLSLLLLASFFFVFTSPTQADPLQEFLNESDQIVQNLQYIEEALRHDLDYLMTLLSQDPTKANQAISHDNKEKMKIFLAEETGLRNLVVSKKAIFIGYRLDLLKKTFKRQSKEADRLGSISTLFNRVSRDAISSIAPRFGKTSLEEMLATIKTLHFIVADISGNLILSLKDAVLNSTLRSTQISILKKLNSALYTVFQQGSEFIETHKNSRYGDRVVSFVSDHTIGYYNEEGPSPLSATQASDHELEVLKELDKKIMKLRDLKVNVTNEVDLIFDLSSANAKACSGEGFAAQL